MSRQLRSGRETTKVLLTLRSEYVNELDALVASGAASSRSEFVDKIVGAFLSDLRERRQAETAVGRLVGFFLLLLGIAAIAEILGGKKRG